MISATTFAARAFHAKAFTPKPMAKVLTLADDAVSDSVVDDQGEERPFLTTSKALRLGRTIGEIMESLDRDDPNPAFELAENLENSFTNYKYNWHHPLVEEIKSLRIVLAKWSRDADVKHIKQRKKSGLKGMLSRNCSTWCER